MVEIFDWLRPVPFWEGGTTPENGEALIRPVLLEYDSDSFMDDFLAEATSCRSAEVDALKQREVSPNGNPLRLYQPAHGRYYLVCASLCCRQQGFPDRVVRHTEDESISFVLRKIANGGTEFAWTVDGKTKAWAEVDGRHLAPDEERLPLFATSSDCQRSLVYGYVPVASRDTYLTDMEVQTPDPSDLAQEHQTRLAQFDENIIRPLQDFTDHGSSLTPEVQQELSLFWLVDLSDMLAANLPAVYAAISAGRAVTAPGPDKDLYDLLAAGRVQETDSSGYVPPRTVVEALKKVIDQRAAIDNLHGGDPLPLQLVLQPDGTFSAAALRSSVDAALPNTFPLPTPPTRETAVAKLADGDTFYLRCVYERPCDAPFPPRLRISEPTYPFQLAAFFDTDAPARPIRISLPADVSIAAMRKFNKGVAFAMSNSMRNKMAMVTGKEKDLLKGDGPGSEGSWNLGFLCSFSIQIIFIVAFFLLLIFVIVLNLIFWWLPFFRICLPLPRKGN